VRVRLSFERPPRLSPRILGQDLVAFWRHFRARLRVVAGDPVALGVLLLAGFAAGFLWLGGAYYSVWYPLPLLGVLLSGLVCAPVAAFAASGTAFGVHAAGPGVLPGLPVGRRSRILADAFAGLAGLVAGRAIFYACFGSVKQSAPAGSFSLAAFVWTSAIGAALTLPVLLVWLVRPRLDVPAVLGGAAVVLAGHLAVVETPSVFEVAPWDRVRILSVFSLLLCVLVLVVAAIRVSVDRDPARRTAASRPSPGALAQMRRERTLGALARLAPLVLLVLITPALLRLEPALLLQPWTGTWMTGLQLVAFAALPLFPMGLPLTLGSDGSFWAGSFARAWSALPLPRETVLRSVWGHAMVAGLAVWVFFVAWIQYLGGWKPGAVMLVAIALGSVPILAGVVVCVSAGASTRGGVAIACLLALSSLVVTMPFDWGVDLLRSPERRLQITLAAAAMLATAGGLPPLGLLRRPRRRAGLAISGRG
jgi:hypothetical protein